MTKQEIENNIEEVNLLWKNGKITLVRRETRLATLNRLLVKEKWVNECLKFTTIEFNQLFGSDNSISKFIELKIGEKLNKKTNDELVDIAVNICTGL